MTVDFSTFHQPVSQSFAETAGTLVQPGQLLSSQQLEFFDKNGYVSGIEILSQPQLELLREELQQLFHPDHDGRELWYEYHSNESGDPENVLFHALGAWRLREGLHDVLWTPNFLVAASQLLGNASVRFWHDQLFCKPARHGGVVAWHQDYSYWTRTRPMQHLTCWIGLDDSTADNGCLQYIPGSHLWDLLPITGLAGDMNAIREVLSEEQWEQFQNPVPIELKAGEAAFHHPLLVHGSRENRTDRPRRAVVLNVFADGTRSDSDEVLLNGVPPISRGEKMEGQFFPLLYNAEAAHPDVEAPHPDVEAPHPDAEAPRSGRSDT